MRSYSTTSSAYYARARRAEGYAARWAERAAKAERGAFPIPAAKCREHVERYKRDAERHRNEARVAAKRERERTRGEIEGRITFGRETGRRGGAPVFSSALGNETRAARALRWAYIEGYAEGYAERERALDVATPEALRPLYTEARALALRFGRIRREARDACEAAGATRSASRKLVEAIGWRAKAIRAAVAERARYYAAKREHGEGPTSGEARRVSAAGDVPTVHAFLCHPDGGPCPDGCDARPVPSRLVALGAADAEAERAAWARGYDSGAAGAPASTADAEAEGWTRYSHSEGWREGREARRRAYLAGRADGAAGRPYVTRSTAGGAYAEGYAEGQRDAAAARDAAGPVGPIESARAEAEAARAAGRS